MNKNKILDVVRGDGFLERAATLLLEMCRIDTTPHPDIRLMARREAEVYSIIERELARLDLSGASWMRHPLNPAIETHPAFSKPLHHDTRPP